MVFRFVDHSKTRIVNEETGHVLAWNPVTDKLVGDHGFAAEGYARAGRPKPLPPVEPAIPDDDARARRRAAGDDARSRVER